MYRKKRGMIIGTEGMVLCMISAEARHRQRDLVKEELLTTPITLIGVGGIGSAVAICLHKVGFPVVAVYDPDVVAEHNIPNQWYDVDDIEKSKAEVIASPREWMYSRSEFHVDWTPTPIVISCVDSIEARKEIWDIVRPSECKWYVDCRMGGEQMAIYTVDNAKPTNKEYEETLWARDEVHVEPCTARAVMYNTMVIAGLCVNNVKKCLMGQDWDKYVIFDLVTMSLVRKVGVEVNGKKSNGKKQTAG